MPEPALTFEGVSLGYRGRTVVQGVNLAAHPGEALALLGPNGSGKTTLLKAASGAIVPIAGRVRLLGQDPARTQVRQVARTVAYVPQREEPTFDVTVREVVLMGRTPHSVGLFDSPEDRAVAEAALERTGCTWLADRPLSELSGGEAQRVLVARALAQGGRILLLDEPTNHLDPAAQASFAGLVRSLTAEGLCVVIATHDLNWAAGCADRAALLARGQVWTVGPVEEALEPDSLCRVYGVAFERVRREDGGFVVVPLG